MTRETGKYGKCLLCVNASSNRQPGKSWKTNGNLYIDDLFKLSGRVQDGHLVDLDREELRVVFDLINARYVNHKTTIFSGEYSIKDISQIDMALGSRIYQMIEPYGLYVAGKNQRIGGH